MTADLHQMLAHAKDIWDTALDGPRPAWEDDAWPSHWAEERRANDEHELAVLTDEEERWRR